MIETIPYISENIKIIRELLEENKKYWNFILINSIDYTELEKEEKKEIKKIMIDEIYPYIRYKDISYTIYKKITSTRKEKQDEGFRLYLTDKINHIETLKTFMDEKWISSIYNESLKDDEKIRFFWKIFF